MKRSTFVAGVMFFFASAASAAAADSYAAQGITPVERGQLTALIARAVSAGQAEAAAAYRNSQLSADDRRDAQSQFALLLLRSGNCADAEAFVSQHNEIRASGIERLTGAALRDGNRQCATRLVPLMLDRWDDPYYTPAGRIAMRFKAGALLDAAGAPGGWPAMRAAEMELLKSQDRSALWGARFDALSAYDADPAFKKYLEYLADRMVAEHSPAGDLKKRSIFAVFAAKGRCDLVERVAGAGPQSCDQAKADADAMYLKPSPSLIASAQQIAAMFKSEIPSLDEAGITAARTAPTVWDRLTRLIFFVDACRKSLEAE